MAHHPEQTMNLRNIDQLVLHVTLLAGVVALVLPW